MQLRHSFPATKLPGSGPLCVLQTNSRPHLHECLPSSLIRLDLMWHKLIPARSASRGQVKDNKYFAFIGYQADTDRVAAGITAIILWAQPNGRRIKQLKQQTLENPRNLNCWSGALSACACLHTEWQLCLHTHLFFCKIAPSLSH